MGKSVKIKQLEEMVPVHAALKDEKGRNIKDTYMEKVDISTISKQEYTQYIGIDSTNENYNKIFFIDGGEGIVTRGQLFAASPYFIKIVDDQVPESEREEGTLYLVVE